MWFVDYSYIAFSSHTPTASLVASIRMCKKHRLLNSDMLTERINQQIGMQTLQLIMIAHVLAELMLSDPA